MAQIECYSCGEDSGYDREYVNTIPIYTDLKCKHCNKVVVPSPYFRIRSYCDAPLNGDSK